METGFGIISWIDNSELKESYYMAAPNMASTNDFNEILVLAAQICDSPYTILTFLNIPQTGIYTIHRPKFAVTEKFNLDTIFLPQNDLLVVGDTHTDAKYSQHSLVTEEPYIRSFASLSIVGNKGETIGYLSVISPEPFQISPACSSGLQLLGRQAAKLYNLKTQIESLANLNNYNSDQKAVAEKLDKQKEFYENILNALPSDIAVFDSNHRYLFVNPGAIRDPEYRKFIVGKDDFEYCEYRKRDKSLAQLRREMFLKVKETRKEIRWEDTVRDPEGNPFTSLRRIFPVYDENNELTMVIGFGMDITDRKIMEEKQSTLVKQLSAQNVQLVDFCNIVSHNLRAPLVNLSMLVEYIQESGDVEEKNELIGKLQPVLVNLHTTFNELVESIQIKQDLEIKSENVLLADCLNRILNEYEMEILKSEAIFQIKIEEAPIIYYPQKYLLSILENLISNALKYRSPARKPIIKLETKKIDSTILLTVSDNGLGVDLEKHKDNFFKIGKVFHRHPNSKGFGLFMTKTQVDAMEGKIWLESTPGAGSTFFIEFKRQNQ